MFLLDDRGIMVSVRLMKVGRRDLSEFSSAAPARSLRFLVC